MPIDPNKARGAKLPDSETSYDRDRVILYHLGIGAGVPATDANELQYTYEKNLKVLPSFAVIPGFGSMGGIASIPGLQFNFAMLLHGEQEVILHKPLPPAQKLKTSAHVPEIYDKGKAALVILEANARDESGDKLFTNRMSLFIRGEGGFGGDSGPKVGNAAPERKPDGVITRKTLPQQALIYRLSGDRNPLHAEPAMAALGNFSRPILHGLCTFGFAGRAVLKHFCGNDPARFKSIRVRFSKHVFPGETLITEMWKISDTTIIFRTKTTERGEVVLSQAAVELQA